MSCLNCKIFVKSPYNFCYDCDTSRKLKMRMRNKCKRCYKRIEQDFKYCYHCNKLLINSKKKK